MTDDRTIELLNRLYAVESTSLLPRLLEVHPFTSAASAARFELIQRVSRHSREHCEWLVEAIEAADGCIRPAEPDPRSGSLHDVSIEALVPLARRGLQELVAAYEAAAGEQLISPDAADLIERSLTHYRQDLADLQAASAAGTGRR